MTHATKTTPRASGGEAAGREGGHPPLAIQPGKRPNPNFEFGNFLQFENRKLLGGFGAHVARPQIDNLVGVSSQWRARIALAAVEAVREFGLDPCTRAQAAAHEAGHVIVAHVAGNKVNGAQISQHVERGRRVWLGENRYTSPHGDGVTTARENPGLVFQLAAMNLAGFAGEALAGLSHPASSIDERAKAEMFAEGIAMVWQVTHDEVMGRLAGWCSDTLTSNQAAFDMIRAHLYQARQLTGADASRMLASVTVDASDEIMTAGRNHWSVE